MPFSNTAHVAFSLPALVRSVFLLLSASRLRGPEFFPRLLSRGWGREMWSYCLVLSLLTPLLFFSLLLILTVLTCSHAFCHEAELDACSRNAWFSPSSLLCCVLPPPPTYGSDLLPLNLPGIGVRGCGFCFIFPSLPLFSSLFLLSRPRCLDLDSSAPSLDV